MTVDFDPLAAATLGNVATVDEVPVFEEIEVTLTQETITVVIDE